MPAIDFPNSPSVDDTYTAGGRTWKWTGIVWESVRATVTGPTGPTGYLAVVTQPGTSYTLATTDVNDLIVFTSASAVTVTVPAFSSPSVAWASGNSIDLMQKGAGQIIVAPAVGVSVRTTGIAKTRDQYSAVTLVYIDTNEWLLQGDTAVA